MYYFDDQGKLIFDTGLYRIKRRKVGGFGDHYGVLSVGVLDPGIVVIDLNNNEQIQVRTFENWLQGKKEWWLCGECAPHDLQQAVYRLKLAIDTHQGYHLFRNNCEHFATWIVDGVHKSTQIVKAKAATAKQIHRGVTMGILTLLRKFIR